MSASRPSILVIDDEPQIHRFLGPAMDAAGYDYVRADDGGAGLAGLDRIMAANIGQKTAGNQGKPGRAIPERHPAQCVGEPDLIVGIRHFAG